MGEAAAPGGPDSGLEERLRARVREALESEMLEWRLALQQIVRRQEELSQALARIERMLPAAVGMLQSAGGPADGLESERRRLERFLQTMERAYADGKITEVELARGRQRIGERLQLLRQAEEASPGP